MKSLKKWLDFWKISVYDSYVGVYQVQKNIVIEVVL